MAHSVKADAKTEATGTLLTEGAMALIESVVDRTNLHDPKELLPKVCDELIARYGNNSLEYHLMQMNLQTTDAIIRAISCYFISKQLFPGKKYGKS